MKISRKTFLRSLGLVIIVILVIFFVKHSFYKNKLFQYKYWIADTEITDYEFLENGEAISVSWAAKKKVTDELRILGDKVKTGGPGYAVGQKFIISQGAKLKSEPSRDITHNNFPYLNRNIPKDGEYWHINVYDTSNSKLKKKELDVFKITREYNKNYFPMFISNSQKIIVDGENEYITLIVGKIGDKSFQEQKLINLKTGKIVDNLNNIKNQSLSVGIEWLESFSKLFKSNGFDFEDNKFHFWNVGNNCLLDTKYPKTRKLLLNNIDNNFIYVLNSKNRLETTLNVIKLAFPDGTNIFKDITIPAENSTDNKEHLIQSEEEFLQYYQPRLDNE
ncbi:MAG: hypothetical protein E6444_08320 [Streptococcus parasanguinis]|uniref:hypothetical protein n=1 Tax=Streptococcus parasanguinis TaxID=1318 RepID=UPI00066A814A|nr:hypothetical protein [Streptococcus parasanguinis]MBZ2091025.1 hypothetical protein [Streptococcus parasanguinis]MDU6759422.1 hypothetical protein [Streptococcus parasanguinis]